MRSGAFWIAGSLILGLGTAAMAQQAGAPPSKQSLDSNGGCQGEAESHPATQPATGRADSTAPGNAGNTGWSGGTGGSFIGTQSSGKTPQSRTWQPATARGLDPISAPKKAASKC